MRTNHTRLENSVSSIRWVAMTGSIRRIGPGGALSLTRALVRGPTLTAPRRTLTGASQVVSDSAVPRPAIQGWPRWPPRPVGTTIAAGTTVTASQAGRTGATLTIQGRGKSLPPSYLGK